MYFVRPGIYPTPDYQVFRALLSLPELGVINDEWYYHAGSRFVRSRATGRESGR
jgi:hypothetical protein